MFSKGVVQEAEETRLEPGISIHVEKLEKKNRRGDFRWGGGGLGKF
jgi:hypothetical protein